MRVSGMSLRIAIGSPANGWVFTALCVNDQVAGIWCGVVRTKMKMDSPPRRTGMTALCEYEIATPLTL